MKVLRSVTGFVLVAVIGVVSLARMVTADDESDRAGLIHDIDDKIGRIADRLSGFDSQSDASNLGDAVSYAHDVKDLVSRLDGVKGDDSRANEIVSRYPGYVDQFVDAASYLRKLKELQFRTKDVGEQCSRDEADLQTMVRYYVGRPEEADDALQVMPDKAREFARKGSDALDKLKDLDRNVQDAASYARFSVSDSYRWPDVSSRFSDAQQRIVQYWRDRYAVVEGNCKRLAAGEKHPDVEKALDDLRRYTGNTKQTVTQLKKDYNEWLRDVRKLREFTDRDRDDLRNAMCHGGYYDTERRVDEVADRWASQISSVYGTTLGQSDRLMSRASDDKIKKYKGSGQVRDGIVANRANLEKLKSYDLQGSNNPKIRAKIEYGKKRHDELGASLCGSSGYTELSISSSYCSNSIRPNSGCRADCVTVDSTCTVIEIKPDNSDAREEGNKQREAYAEGLRRWYDGNKDELFSKYPNLKACEHDGKSLSVTSRLETYDFCPDAKEFGDEIPNASSDLSESSD